MDQDREHGKRVEDLPVDEQQAAEVKGGQDFHFSTTSPSSVYVSPAVIKGFNPQPDPPKV